MRRLFRFTLACLSVGAFTACKSPELVVPTEFPNYAGVRFINAVPDSAGVFGMDMRFVDLLESNAHFRVAFRNSISSSAPFVSSQIQYKGALEGSRHFKVFLDDTLQSVATKVLADRTEQLVKGHNYTGIMWGYGRCSPTATPAAACPGTVATDSMRFSWWEETFAQPTLVGSGTTKPTEIGIRVINAMNVPVDVRFYAGTAVSAALAAAATPIAVAPFSKSDYTLLAPGNYMINVRPAGGAAGTELFTDTRSIPGALAQCSAFTACVATAIWDPTAAYAAGALVRMKSRANSVTDSSTFLALAAVVAGVDPSSDTTRSKWQQLPAPDIEATPGTLVAGSAVSAIVFPRSTPAEAAPAAPVATLAATPGSIEAGTYRYRVTFVTTSGETQGGASSAIVTVTNPAVAGQINLTAIPLGGPLVNSRRIFRVGSTGTYLVGTLNDNTTTTFTDNMAATGATGTPVPSANTTIRTPQGTAFTVPAVSWTWDKRPPRGCLPAYCGE